MRVRAAGEDVSERHWQGYVNSLDEPKRVPLAVAWQAVFAPEPGAFKPESASSVRPEEKALIGRWAATDGSRSDWVADDLRALLAAASERPSSEAPRKSPD